MMILSLTYAELRKQASLLRTYYANTLINQFIYIASFVLLSGLSQIITDGNFDTEEKLSFLVGYITWWVAGQCMMGIANTVAQDARWGTLEQVRLSGVSPVSLMAARSLTLIIYYTLQALVMATVIVLIYRLPLSSLQIGLLLPYLLALLGALGLSFAFTGLHIIFKNVAVLADALSFMFFFLSGILSPLQRDTALYALSRFLPLSSGIDVMRLLLVQDASWQAPAVGAEFGLLLLNTATYLLVGCTILLWGFRRSQMDGSLAHY